MMSRNRIVKCGGLVRDAAMFFRLVRIDQEYARTAAIFGRRVVFARSILLAKCRIRLDDHIRLWPESERGTRAHFLARQRRLRKGDQLLAILERVLLIGAQLLQQRRDVTGL